MSDQGATHTPVLVRIAAWSAGHPLLVVAIAVIVLAASVLSLSRARLNPSLQAMLGDRAPSAAALARITDEYRALDELLVIASRPADEPAGDAGTSRLTAFAERLGAAVRADPESAAMVEHIAYRHDPALARYVREVILPNGAYYLSEAGFDALIHRLSPEQIRVQIARNEALVAAPGPAAGAIGGAILRDPLRLSELIDADAFPAAAGLAAPGDDSPPELSSDGRSLLIRIAGARPVNDLDFSQRLTDAVGRLVSRSNTDALGVGLAGGYAIAATTSRAMRADSITSALVAVALLHGLFFIFYRRAAAPLLISIVAGLGIVAGFGVHALFIPTITPLTAVIAAMLAGLGVDYGIHLLSHYDALRAEGRSARDAVGAAVRHIGTPVVANCVTSIFGFASLWPSSVAMLRDFAALGALGLLGSLVAVLTLMPALLVLTDRRARGAPERGGYGRMADAVARHPRACIGACAALLGAIAVGAVAQGGVPRIETDLTVMHPRPNAALDLTLGLSARFSGAAETIPVELRAESPGALVIAAHDAARALQSADARAAGISGAIGLNVLLPDPRSAPSRRERLGEVDPDAVIDAFDAAVRDSLFNPAAFEGYRGFLRTLVTPGEPPRLETVLAYPAIAERLFPAAAVRGGPPPTSTLLAIGLDHALADRVSRDEAVRAVRTALAPVPGATPTGLSVVGHDLEQGTRADLPRSIAISVALVIAWLFIVFRRPGDVALALTPLLFGGLCLVGLIVTFGQHLNPVNGVALPLLDGIAVDAGVFLVAASRHAGTRSELLASLRWTAHAILAAATTTVAGFAALMLTRTPAIQSLGLLGAAGITLAMLGALLLLMPIILLSRRSVHEPRPPEPTP